MFKKNFEQTHKKKLKQDSISISIMTVHRGSWIELIPLLIAAAFVAWLAVTQLDALGLAPTVAAHGYF